MKKILIIHHGGGVGGGLIALLGLIQELKRTHLVTVLCIFDSVALDYLRRDGTEVFLADSAFYKKNYDLFVHSDASFFSFLGAIRRFRSLVFYGINAIFYAPAELRTIASDFDIVYLNSVFITDWAPAARNLGKQVVVHAREPLSKGVFGIRRALIRMMTRKYASLAIAISEDNKRRLGLPEMTVKVYDPVYVVAESPKIIAVQADLKYFTYVGGSQRIKGFEQLVDCLPYLAPNVRIFFLGYDHELHGLSGWKFAVRKALSVYNRRLPELKQKLHASDHIVDIGLTSDVFSYYRQSLALISPFAAPHASLPIMECLALGKPVIASDVSGTEELVTPENGILFRNGDARALAQAINTMAESSQESLAEMAAAAQRRYADIVASNPSIASLLETL